MGSGFDVSSAFFGSHIYTRFSPALLAPLLEAHSRNEVEGPALVQLLTAAWDTGVQPLHLPHGLVLVLGDVHAGSHTPSMVGKVLKWRAGPGAEELWTRTAATNARVEAALGRLGSLDLCESDNSRGNVNIPRLELARLPPTKWPLFIEAEQKSGTKTAREMAALSAFVEAQGAFQEVRRFLQELGACADVPIEPTEQTALLDATAALPGVLMAGVPGAGGFDAVFALLLDESCVGSVRELWQGSEQVTCHSFL